MGNKPGKTKNDGRRANTVHGGDNRTVGEETNQDQGGTSRPSSKAAEGGAFRTRQQMIKNPKYDAVKRVKYCSILADYNMESKVLGSGYSGPVKSCTHKLSGVKFACKTFSKKGKTVEKLDMFRNEVEIFLSLDHPHVCKLVDVYETATHIYMVMEFCNGGELYDRLHSAKQYGEDLARQTALEMLLAVNYLHAHGIVHRDLKLENFLYENTTNDARLKLIDFGFSKVWDPKTLMKASCGSVSYVSPDVLKGNYTNKCDMWSYGVIVFMLLSGYPPFYGTESQMFQKIKEGRYFMREDRWSKVSSDGRAFVRELLVVNPEWRLSAPAALKHVWMTKDVVSPGGQAFSKDVVKALKDYGSASHFQRVALTMLAWHLDTDDRKALAEIFLKIDKEKVGEISLKSLAQVLAKEFHINNDEVHRILKNIDVNSNHTLDYSEFLAAMLKTRVTLHEDLLRIGFDRFDVSHTGYITKEDLGKALGDQFSSSELDVIMSQVDTDHDGRISFDEFVEAMHSTSPVNDKFYEKTGRVIDKAIEENDDEHYQQVNPDHEASPVQRKKHGTVTKFRTQQSMMSEQERKKKERDDPFAMHSGGGGR